MARQRTFFHKCHRCVYRGKAANWEPAAAAPVLIDVPLAVEAAKAARAGVPTLEVIVETPVAAPAPAKRPARKKAAAAAAAPVAEAGA